MTNVSKGMEYASAFEREAMREKLDAALGDVNDMNLIEIEAILAAHLLELKQLVTPMMEFNQKMPTKICGPNLVGILNSAGFYQKKEWVGLTDEELFKCSYDADDREDAMRAVEAKLKEKNGG
jgi:hypothetical protein